MPAFLLLVLVALAISCYSSSYRSETAANACLLSDLAAKLKDYCRAGFNLGWRQVTSEEMGEFYYALKKARSFAAMEEPEASSRPSYRQFQHLLDEYERFLRDADQYRLSPDRDPQKLSALLLEADSVQRQAASVASTLAAEAR